MAGRWLSVVNPSEVLTTKSHEASGTIYLYSLVSLLSSARSLENYTTDDDEEDVAVILRRQ